MSINKGYFALLSASYNFQSCKIAPIESESDHQEKVSSRQSEFPIKAQIFYCSSDLAHADRSQRKRIPVRDKSRRKHLETGSLVLP